jgi:hypothetical protein
LGADLILSAAWQDTAFLSIGGVGSSHRPITGKFKVEIMLKAAWNLSH